MTPTRQTRRELGLVALAAARSETLPWVAQMIGAIRHIERYADHAVDVAEQVIFMVTGEHDDRPDATA
jgi:phosphate uptake regulator